MRKNYISGAVIFPKRVYYVNFDSKELSQNSIILCNEFKYTNPESGESGENFYIPNGEIKEIIKDAGEDPIAFKIGDDFYYRSDIRKLDVSIKENYYTDELRRRSPPIKIIPKRSEVRETGN